MARSFIKLTREAIRKLKPGGKLTEAGITVERLVDSDTRYTVAIMVDGERIHRVVGRASDGTTRTQAEEFITSARAKAKEERLDLPQGRKVHLNFSRAADIYLARLREEDGKGLAEKERHLRLMLIPELGGLRVDKISEFRLAGYRRTTKAKGYMVGKKQTKRTYTDSTINRSLRTYSHMANSLFGWGEIKTPMAKPKLIAEDNRRDTILDEDQKATILEAALHDSNDRVWLFLMIGLHTSMRHAEILSLRFEDFDNRERRIRVKVKGGRWRRQPLTRTIADVIQRERDMADDDDQDGWLFPSSRAKSGHVHSMKKAFRRVVLAAGMNPRKVIPHTMRHTAITDLTEITQEDQTVKEFSGHKSWEMVRRYTHARQDRVNAALDALDERGTKVVRMPRHDKKRS